MEVTDGEEIECGECGRSVAAGRPFCPFCGSSLEIVADYGDGVHEGLGSPDSVDTVQTKSDNQDGLPGLEDFDIKGEISRGGMGIVYRAVDRKLDRVVAIKVIAPDLATDDGFRARFIAESKAIASLNNPHILPIYQTGEGDGTLFQVTKYATGGDLSEELERKGRLDLRQVSEIVSQIADALDAAHEKSLIHRDVKPANILIDSPEKTGGRPVYLLSDFGVATSREGDSRLTETGEVLGTVDYMAPEQIEGGDFDQRVDVYALGCVAMELLAGEPPFRRDSKQATMMAHLREDPALPSRIEGADPQAVAAVFGRALAKNPDQRYQTCTAFAGDLERAAGGIGVPVPTSATSALPPVQQSTSARGRAILAGLGAVLLLGIGAGAFLYIKDQETPVNRGDRPFEGSLDTTEDPDPTPPAEPPERATSLSEVAAKGDFSVTNDDLLDVTNAYDFADYESEDGELPNIAGKDYEDAIVIGGTTLYREPSRVEFPLDDYTKFTGKVGVSSALRSSRSLNVKIKATRGDTGEDQELWSSGPLTSAMDPREVDLTLEPTYTKLVFLVAGVKDEDVWKDDWVVIADPELTGPGKT